MDWKESLAEELRNAESLKDFKDINGLAKAFIDAKAYQGQSVRIPGPDAGVEDKKAFLAKLQAKLPQVTYMPETEEEKAALEPELWKRLGRPSELKEYDLAGVELPPGVEVNVDELRAAAAGLGLTKKQFAEYAKGFAGEKAKLEAAMKADQDGLKREWGVAYQDKLAGIAETAKKLGAADDVVEALRSGKYPAKHLKVWDAVMKAMGAEGGEAKKLGDGGTAKLTPEEAQLRMAEIRGNPAYFRREVNPGLHEHLMKEMVRLQEMARGGR